MGLNTHVQSNVSWQWGAMHSAAVLTTVLSRASQPSQPPLLLRCQLLAALPALMLFSADSEQSPQHYCGDMQMSHQQAGSPSYSKLLPMI